MKRKLLQNGNLPTRQVSALIGAVIMLFAFTVKAQNTGDFRSRWNTTGGSATTAPGSLAVSSWELYDATTGLWTSTLTIPQASTKDIYIREGVQQNFNNNNTYGTNVTVGQGNAAIATATISGGAVTAVTVNNAGSLIVFPNLQLLGPSTTLATASITDASVVGYDISHPGSNYTSPTVTIGNLWTAATAYATNAQVNSGGLLYTCLAGGTSGATAPTGTGSSVSDDVLNWKYAGTAATATATVGSVVRGATTYTNGISAVNITNQGSGYISMPSTVISDASGTLAVLEARIGINLISVTNGGTGYTETPAVNLGSCYIAGSPSSSTARTVVIKGNLEFKYGATCVNGGPTLPAAVTNIINLEGSLITASDVKFFHKVTGVSNVNYNAVTTVNFTNNANSVAINSTGGTISFATVSVAAGKTLTIGTTLNPVSIKLTQATPIGFNTTGIINAANARIELLSYPIASAIAQTIASGTFQTNTVKALTINNTAGVTTNSDITVTENLNQQAGIFTIATGKTVKLTSGNAIGGTFGASSYINTTSNTGTGAVGVLQLENFTAARTFPIGNSSNYLPITVTPTGASVFAANVFTGATANGAANGAAVADKTTIVDAVYNLNKVSGGNASLTLGFTSGLKGAALTTSYGIAMYNGSTWDAPSGTSDDFANTATANFSSFSAFRVEKITTLSVNLTSLKAKANGNNVKIDWVTKSELNSNKFLVERSIDGVKFEKVTEVKSKGASSYTAYDYAPINGKNYYRLIQYNVDGTFETFGPVSATFSLNASSALIVFPNPTSGNITFKTEGLSGNASVLLTNVQGKVIYTGTLKNVSAAESYKLNLNQVLTPGQYNLQVSGVGFSKTTKVIVF